MTKTTIYVTASALAFLGAILFAGLAGAAPEARAGFAALSATGAVITMSLLYLTARAIAERAEAFVREKDEDLRELRARETPPPPRQRPRVLPLDIDAKVDARTEKLKQMGTLVSELLRDDLDLRDKLKDLASQWTSIEAERDELRERVAVADRAFAVWREATVPVPAIVTPGPDEYGQFQFAPANRNGRSEVADAAPLAVSPAWKRPRIVSFDQLERDIVAQRDHAARPNELSPPQYPPSAK